MAQKKNLSGIWIMVVAAILLEAISCVMYFTSRAAIKHEAEQLAKTELRKAELEIENHTIEMETAVKTLVMLSEKHIDYPDSIFSATRLAVRTLNDYTSMAVAFVPNYYRKQGRWFEACSSRITEDSVYTRQIGSAEHDYFQAEWYQNGFLRDSCWWSEPYLDDSGSKTWVVSCSHPVRDRKGEIVAVVCCDLSLDYLQKVSEYLQIYPKSHYSIHSHDGLAIVPTPDTIPGAKYQIYNEEIDATGWQISIIIPEDVIFADLNRMGLIIGILMIIGLAVLALMVWHSAITTRKMIDFAEKNQRIEGELEVAQTIQNAMLPKVFPPFTDRPDINLYGMVDPAKEIGGDLYDFYIRHGKLFFCVGDVSGKGVPAALVMAMTRSLFRSITAHEEAPDLIMRKMNRALVDQNAQNMFLTFFLGILDCETGRLDYCNAGHNAPVLIRREGTKMEHFEDLISNLPLGVETDFVFKAQHTQMAYDDVLFLYTDGLTEAEKSDHEQYGEERMYKALEADEARDLSPRELVAHMQHEVEQFVDGAPQSDDLTMLVVRYQKPSLFMRNDIQQIPTLAEWIEGLDLPTELSMPINLALEEAVSNVMLYAYPGQHGQVLIEFSKEKSIIFTITDSGIPFDPTQQREADTTLSLEERQIGGLGIHLVRQLMDEIYYRREDNKNVLTLIKHI